ASSSSLLLHIDGSKLHDARLQLVVQRPPATHQASATLSRLLFGQVRIPLQRGLFKTLRLPRLPTDLVAYRVHVLDTFGRPLALPPTVIAKALATGEKKVFVSHDFMLRWNIPHPYTAPYRDQGFELCAGLESDMILAIEISWSGAIGLVARR